MSAAWSADEVRRARVRAQGLDGGRPAPGGTASGVAEVVARVVGRVVGIQAQDAMAAALSIRPRGPGLLLDDVHAALRDGSIVLTWTVRGTRHYHAREDVRWLVSLLGPVFGRPGRRARQLGIDGEVGDQAVRVLRRALETDGPLTRAQVRKLLGRHGVDPSGQAPVHVIFRAACEGILCVVPEPGGDERYALLDEWVPATLPPVGAAPAAGELARRYLLAFGPATPADLAAWSGLPAAVVREAWAAVLPDLVEIAGPAGPAWVLSDGFGAGKSPAAPVARAPVRLLGGYDTFLLGYADRSLHLPPDHARSVNAGGGIVRPVVLDDGRAVATWALRRRRTRVTDLSAPAYEAEINPFAGGVPDIGAELDDVGRFLGIPPPAVRPGSP
jgi:Winged helix DNA-binding domain